MRAMDNKEVIYAIKSDGSIHLGIDTPEDLLKARKLSKIDNEIFENRSFDDLCSFEGRRKC